MQRAKEVSYHTSGALLPLLPVSADPIFPPRLSWSGNLINPSGHEAIIFPMGRLGFVFQLVIMTCIFVTRVISRISAVSRFKYRPAVIVDMYVFSYRSMFRTRLFFFR